MRQSAQLFSLAYLASAGVGAAVAIRQELPGEFAGRTTGWSARKDFLVGPGTALSPPLSMLALQVILTALSLGRGRAAEVGLGGLAALGGAATVGMLGEPITYRVTRRETLDPPKAVLVLTLIVLPLLMTILAVRRLLTHRDRH